MKAHFSVLLTLIFGGQLYTADADLTAIRNYIAARAGMEAYQGDTKCGIRYQMDVIRLWDELSQQEQHLWLADVKQDTARSEKLITPSGHFMLHWDNQGDNMVPQTDVSGNGIPDFIDSAAVIFDRVWDIEVSQLGYALPVGPDGLPIDLHHVYFTDLPVYGEPVPERTVTIDGNVKYISYMQIDNDFSDFFTTGLEALKVTAAHEFHHILQLGYNVRQNDFFFYEMTSTWMEEKIYPEINDYFQYMDILFFYMSNTEFDYYAGAYSYGNALYVIMLDQIYGADIVRNIWESLLGRPLSMNALVLDGLRDVLARAPYNSSWLASLQEYGKWLHFTGDRTIPQMYFPDAAYFPKIRIARSDTYIFPDQIPESLNITELANRYIRLIGLRGSDLNLTVSASTFSEGGFSLLSNQEATPFYHLGESFASSNMIEDTVIVQLVNAQYYARDFGLDISSTATTDITMGPNPVRVMDGEREVLFRNIPEDGHIYIYNAAGLEVAHIEESASPNRIWNLQNRNGEPVASGIYIYLVKSAEQEHRGKFAIIK